MIRRPPRSTLFPSTTLSRSLVDAVSRQVATLAHVSNYFATPPQIELAERLRRITGAGDRGRVMRRRRSASSIDRKSTRLNSSHQIISYAVFCLKKKKNIWPITAKRTFDGVESAFRRSHEHQSHGRSRRLASEE